MTKQTSSNGTAAWFLASAGLCVAVVFQLNNEISITVPVTAAPADPKTIEMGYSNVDSLVPPDFALLDMIVDRPLFTVSRRPFESPIDTVPNVTPVVAKTMSFKLLGTMVAGDARLALLSHPEKGMLRLRQGQEVDGWRIEDVRGHDVMISRGDETVRLKLQKSIPSSNPLQLAVEGPSQAASDEDSSEAQQRQRE
jgi:hypothetical protein